jgi:hypothetical protein
LLNFEELEETLSRLDSVDAVRVVGDGGKVSEVHVVATPTKPAKQVVRDVQSLAMARYGTNIDRRVISVVQLAGDDLGRRTAERPVILGIKEEPDGSRLTVRVTLGWHDNDHVGTASGPAATSARLRLVGEATIGALESLYPDMPPLALDSVGTAAVGMRTAVIAVVVGSVRSSEEEIVVGAALSQGDTSETTVRAVLDALNRRLATMSQ